jgi:hypothetical protein
MAEGATTTNEGLVSPKSQQAARRMDRPGEVRQLAFLKIAHSITGTLPTPNSERQALGGRTPWGPDRRAVPKAAAHWGIGPAAR